MGKRGKMKNKTEEENLEAPEPKDVRALGSKNCAPIDVIAYYSHKIAIGFCLPEID